MFMEDATADQDGNVSGYADVGVLEWCRIDAMSPLVLDINWWSSAVGVMLLELWNCCWSFAARAMQLLLKFCNNC
ncbi:hypothetical protein LINPERPRIM_LOCUS41093 [Linum perenne]